MRDELRKLTAFPRQQTWHKRCKRSMKLAPSNGFNLVGKTFMPNCHVTKGHEKTSKKLCLALFYVKTFPHFAFSLLKYWDEFSMPIVCEPILWGEKPSFSCQEYYYEGGTSGKKNATDQFWSHIYVIFCSLSISFEEVTIGKFHMRAREEP